VHPENDSRLGQPLCGDCYDYAAAAWFNYYASAELWRRFTTYLPRALATSLGLSERRLRELVRVQYAKVAEFQRRGVVHFHAVLRIDGPAVGDSDDPYPPPLLDVPVDILASAVRDAVHAVAYRVPAWTVERPGIVLRFGRQIDVSPIRHDDQLAAGAVTPAKVAAYIAKYATKAADDFGLGPRLADVADLTLRPDISAHVRRHVETVHELSRVQPRMGRWLHMLGFPGHFATKSRAFSTTLGALRGERRAHRLRAAESRRRQCDPGPVEELLDAEAQDASTLVIGIWHFAGLGYRTTGDAELAAAAAARARERARPPSGVLPVAAGRRS
jgi:hypothetical protein